ncbi:YnfC family lipoprotein [Pantoea sp. BIGb0393]|uniref:YnfC family lipoprotein n=1 Tax=Pantoea nemavictus TaxID=2726955 RepID=A0ABU8PMJ4_9GAMM|nr:YnfC family lipoprotein [Pantoea nemavictus]
MKKTLLFWSAIVLLAGCDKDAATFYPQMKNYAYLYQFEALPGNVKSTHQTLFTADGQQIFEVNADFDRNGCLTHVKSVGKAGEVIEVSRDGDALKGSENGQDVVVTLDKNCAMVKKVTPTMTVDIAYNKQGLVEQISSPASDAAFHLAYNSDGEMAVLSITQAGTEVSRASAVRAEDKQKISDVVTTVKRNDQIKTVSNVCQYKNAVPYYCDIITTDAAGKVVDKQYGKIDVSYY